MIIEVCGKGCPKCHATKENIGKALQELNLKEGEDAAVTEVKDPKMMAARGVMMTPAVIIDGVKVSEGKTPDVQDVKKWIEQRLPK
jgi:galactitol-specific phosphotransferase system IIB component